MVTVIENFSSPSLNNGAHYDFMKRTAQLAQADTAVNTKAAAQVAVFGKKLETEDECLKISQKNPLSDEIIEADRERDTYYIGLKGTVRGMRNMPDEEIQKAAKVVWQSIKDYHIDTKAALSTETGYLDNFATDMTGKYAAEIATLGLTKVVSNMKTANDNVRQLMTQRDAENSTKVVGALKAARIETDEAYNNLVQRVNALNVVDGDNDYSAFIATMNEMIKQFREQILTKKTKKKEE